MQQCCPPSDWVFPLQESLSQTCPEFVSFVVLSFINWLGKGVVRCGGRCSLWSWHRAVSWHPAVSPEVNVLGHDFIFSTKGCKGERCGNVCCFLLWVIVKSIYSIKYWQIILYNLQTQNTCPHSEISEIVLKMHHVIRRLVKHGLNIKRVFCENWQHQKLAYLTTWRCCSPIYWAGLQVKLTAPNAVLSQPPNLCSIVIKIKAIEKWKLVFYVQMPRSIFVRNCMKCTQMWPASVS